MSEMDTADVRAAMQTCLDAGWTTAAIHELAQIYVLKEISERRVLNAAFALDLHRGRANEVLTEMAAIRKETLL